MKECIRLTKGMDKYLDLQGDDQPVGCFISRNCWYDRCDHIHTHPSWWDDGNGLYLVHTNILVSILQINTIESVYVNRPVISSYVDQVRNDIVEYIMDNLNDEYADYPEWHSWKGIY